MKEQNFDVNKLRVASSCPTNWETMCGNNKVRFCDLCSLNVYDFSEMTSEEIKALITKSDRRICGKIYKRADGTILTQDCPVGLRAYYKRTTRFAGAVLTAILGLFSVSFGQSDSKKDKETVSASKIKIVRTINQKQESSLSGTVFDENGAVIPNAEIILVKKDQKFKTYSTDTGEYIFNSVSFGTYDLEIKFLGFKSLRITDLEIKKGENNMFDITLKTNGLVTLGVVAFPDDELLITSTPTVKHTITREMLDRINR